MNCEQSVTELLNPAIEAVLDEHDAQMGAAEKEFRQLVTWEDDSPADVAYLKTIDAMMEMFNQAVLMAFWCGFSYANGANIAAGSVLVNQE